MPLLRRFAPLALCLAAACGDEAPRPALVFAASSLTDAFTALEAAFEHRREAPGVDLHFAGSQALALQLREGAPADLFAAADARQMQRAIDVGRAAGDPVDLARNTLVIAVRSGNPRSVQGAGDLARNDLAVALCGPDVPAGHYARTALERAGIGVRSVSDEPNVRALASKIALGELDAGVVYRTDVTAAPKDLQAVTLGIDVAALYSIVRTSGGRNVDEAEAFLAFVLSDDGRAILREHGFDAP